MTMVTKERRELIERYFAPKKQIPADQLDEVGRKIFSAFEGPYRDWRTVGSIADEIGITEGDVLVYIDRHPDWFLRSVHATGVMYAKTVTTAGEGVNE